VTSKNNDRNDPKPQNPKTPESFIKIINFVFINKRNSY
jgi:hypothetical protein